MTRSLGALVGAETTDLFLERYFGKDAFRCHIGSEAASSYFGWRQLNAALAEHRFAPPRLRLERAGADVTKGLFSTRRTRRNEVLSDLDPVVLNERLREGATLILDAANEVSAPLQGLCAGLAAQFACPCQANMYACWGTTQGFDVHWDDHDVFVIQVEGSKRWALYGPTVTAPTRRGGASEDKRPETPLEEILLQPGDVLYLPRGYWHAAVGVGGPTMHLTVGLTRKIGSDFLHWLADQALADSATRQDLPFEQGDEALAEHVSRLLAAVASADAKDVAQRYRRYVESVQSQRPQLSFPFIGEHDAALGTQTRISLAPGAARLEIKDEAECVLSWRGTQFTLSRDVHQPLSDMINGAVLTLAQLQEATAAPSRPLLADFIVALARRGALLIHQEGGE